MSGRASLFLFQRTEFLVRNHTDVEYAIPHIQRDADTNRKNYRTIMKKIIEFFFFNLANHMKLATSSFQTNQKVSILKRKWERNLIDIRGQIEAGIEEKE